MLVIDEIHIPDSGSRDHLGLAASASTDDFDSAIPVWIILADKVLGLPFSTMVVVNEIPLLDYTSPDHLGLAASTSADNFDSTVFVSAFPIAELFIELIRLYPEQFATVRTNLLEF